MSREFYYPDSIENNYQKALVLIQGPGDIRAGIWSRSLCLNEDLKNGSMLPIVDMCREKNIALLIMNPNYNKDPETGVTVPYSSDACNHAVYVW